MIKAIIFDLGDVIVKVDRANLYRKLAKASGKNIGEITGYCENSPSRKDFERGKLNAREFYDKFAKELNLKINFNDFKKYYCDIFTLNNNVAKLIQKLKNRYRLVLLSNTDELHFEYIKNKFEIVDIFDDCVLSYEAGCRKPNPLIFLKAIKKSKTSPFNIAYFDDIPEFVFVARLMGVKAFQFNGYKKFIGDLKKIQVISKTL